MIFLAMGEEVGIENRQQADASLSCRSVVEDRDVLTKQPRIFLSTRNLGQFGFEHGKKRLYLLHRDARPVGEVMQRSRAISAQIFSEEFTLGFDDWHRFGVHLRLAFQLAFQPLIGADENDFVAFSASVTD